jgi:hypothetical protein
VSATSMGRSSTRSPVRVGFSARLMSFTGRR